MAKPSDVETFPGTIACWHSSARFLESFFNWQLKQTISISRRLKKKLKHLTLKFVLFARRTRPQYFFYNENPSRPPIVNLPKDVSFASYVCRFLLCALYSRATTTDARLWVKENRSKIQSGLKKFAKIPKARHVRRSSANIYPCRQTQWKLPIVFSHNCEHHPSISHSSMS